MNLVSLPPFLLVTRSFFKKKSTFLKSRKNNNKVVFEYVEIMPVRAGIVIVWISIATIIRRATIVGGTFQENHIQRFSKVTRNCFRIDTSTRAPSSPWPSWSFVRKHDSNESMDHSDGERNIAKGGISEKRQNSRTKKKKVSKIM